MMKFFIKKPLEFFNVDVNFTFNSKFISIFGKSGSGKTTILRCIAGLETPENGEIKIENDVWFSSKLNINLPPQKRNIGFVFQQSSLFPNMTVEENIKFALNDNDETLFEELISISNVKALLKRKPNKLSGGEKQKVALLRAIARKPKLLLLDEPFTGLDFDAKFDIYNQIKLFSKRFNFYTILVSHDILEVVKFTDFVFYIEKGKIIKQGKPKEVLPLEKILNLYEIY